MQRVHTDRVARRIDLCGSAGSLEDSELRLELRRVATKGVERALNRVEVVPVTGAREVFELGQGRQ
jgi:hypothetical protein